MLLLATVCFGQTPIQHFAFDNSLSNSNSTITFAVNPLVTANGYAVDRFGNSNSSKVLLYNNNTYDYLNANIPNLPVGDSPRTITMWVRFEDNLQQKPMFGYGSQVNNQAFGLTQGVGTVDSNIIENYRWGANNSTFVTTPTGTSTWYCYALVYSGTVCKIYRDGDLLVTSDAVTLQTTGTSFWIGRVIGDAAGLLNARIDDLRIYNQELSNIEVAVKYINEAPPATLPTVTDGYETNVYDTQATINFKVDANGGSAGSTIKYGTSPSTLTNTATGPSTTANIPKLLNYTLTGLLPNTTYYCNIDVANTAGTVSLPSPFSFTTTPNGTVAPLPTYKFQFNGTLDSTPSGNLFATSATVTYVSNGNIANEAIRINNNVLESTLNKIALGNTERSIVFRIKYNNASVSNQYVFAYGSQNTRNGFGFAQISATSSELSFWSPAPNIAFAAPAQTWITYVVTAKYEAANSSMRIKYYKDGTEVYSGLQGGNILTSGTQFWLGQGIGSGAYNNLNADLDELRIYNKALTLAEITEVNTFLANDNFTGNLKFSMYPNPANNILNIEIEKEIQSVEIYSLQGQKVFSGNDKTIDIANLSSGIYMIKVEDENGAIATQKLIKK